MPISYKLVSLVRTASRALALTALASAMLPLSGMAQGGDHSGFLGGYSASGGASSWFGTPGTEYEVCGSWSGVQAGVSSFECALTGLNGGTAAFSTWANAENGQLHAYASAELVNFVDPSPSSDPNEWRPIWNGAHASWNEVLWVPETGLVPDFARFHMMADGFAHTTGPYSSVHLDLWFTNFTNSAAGAQIAPSMRVNPIDCCQAFPEQIFQESLFTFDVPLVAGANLFSFAMAVTAHTTFQDGVAVTGSSEMDYRNTARIAGIQLFQGGDDVTLDQQQNVSFGSGVQYSFGAPSSTVTPEPVSMALLGTGLAGLGAVRRRRRKEAETA